MRSLIVADESLRTLLRRDPDSPAALRARQRVAGCCAGTGWREPWERCPCGLPPCVEEADSWLPPEVDRIDKSLPQELIDAQCERWVRIGLATGPTDRELARAGVTMAYREAGLKPPREWIWLESPLQGASQVWSQVWSKVRSQVSSQVWSQVWLMYWGSQDAHWLGYHETWLRAGLRAPLSLRGFMWAAQACGWWWPGKDTVVVTDRPAELTETEVVYPDGWRVPLD